MIYVLRCQIETLACVKLYDHLTNVCVKYCKILWHVEQDEFNDKGEGTQTFLYFLNSKIFVFILHYELMVPVGHLRHKRYLQSDFWKCNPKSIAADNIPRIKPTNYTDVLLTPTAYFSYILNQCDSPWYLSSLSLCEMVWKECFSFLVSPYHTERVPLFPRKERVRRWNEGRNKRTKGIPCLWHHTAFSYLLLLNVYSTFP